MSDNSQLEKDFNEYQNTIGLLMSQYETASRSMISIFEALKKHEQLIEDNEGPDFVQRLDSWVDIMKASIEGFSNVVEGVLPQS